ncbi:PIP5K8 [Symbiodinium natans]|uniref:PIP5K8 protein n=1 Tax=Symbiodinium natans TaxID=878477 RepID=A0A812NWW1_9DINO|nr:PIP5K8 [Symbiodinium natans]
MQSHQAPVWNSLTAASKRAVGASSEAALGARDRVLILGMVMSLDLRGTDEWLLPIHLQPAIYWLRLEDVTELEGSIWPRVDPLELPFRVE